MGRAGTGSDGIRELVAQIRRYVSTHPSAADDLNGISRHWLNLPAGSDEAVRSAVEQLVADGYLQREQLVGGSTIYRRRSA